MVSFLKGYTKLVLLEFYWLVTSYCCTVVNDTTLCNSWCHLFLFIMSNIWVITISLHFSGTWFITSLMLLAVIMQLVWDYDKWKYIFYKEPYLLNGTPPNYPPSKKIWMVAGFILFIWSLVGMLVLEGQHTSSKLFSRVWLASILITVLLTLFLSRKNKRQII